jgi:hypothetical protein
MKGVVEENSSHYCCNLLFLFRLSCRDVAIVSVMACLVQLQMVSESQRLESAGVPSYTMNVCFGCRSDVYILLHVSCQVRSWVDGQTYISNICQSNAGSCASRATLCFGAALSRLLCLLPFLFGKRDPPKPREVVPSACCTLLTCDPSSMI